MFDIIVFIGPVNKQRLFIHDILFIDHFIVSGDMRRCFC